MLGIQSSHPMTNQIKFGSNPNYGSYRDDVEAEKKQKLQNVNDLRDEFDSLADSLEQNNDKVSKKAGKVVRFGAAALGMAATFFAAKYGSRAVINTFKQVGKSETVTKIISKAKNLKEPAQKVIGKAGELIDKTGLKNSKLVTKATEFLNKEPVQRVVTGAKDTVTKFANKVKNIKVQELFENTMGASATASVLIDDLAGRNGDKSAFDLAMGASGGDV